MNQFFAIAKNSNKPATVETKPERPEIKVGDIWSCSWGYDQTNVDFYKIVKVTPKTVTLQKIDTKHHEALNGLAERVVPDPDSVCKWQPKPFRRKISWYRDEPQCKIESYSFARPWDGEPEYQSHYA